MISAIVIIALSIMGYFKSSSLVVNIPMLLFVLVSIVSIVDTVWSKKWILSKWIEKRANVKEAEAFDKEYKKYTDIL